MADTHSSSAEAERKRTERERSSPILQRNIRAMAELTASHQRPKSIEDRVAMTVSKFAGSMKFVYVHAIVYGTWAAAHMGLLPGIRHIDRDLIVLNTVATVEAIFLATFVLIAQNRMAASEEIRTELDVQVSLLVETETTQILRLVAAMGEKMGIEEVGDPEVQQLIRRVEAQEIIDQIEGEIQED
ncbi:MAG TPA: DUF1003 domain-containing protein [Gemmatimonadaceae bacterium]|nr:DUF1003 domain-containing protein [Gemmatimonadaceae bacterium]